MKVGEWSRLREATNCFVVTRQLDCVSRLTVGDCPASLERARFLLCRSLCRAPSRPQSIALTPYRVEMKRVSSDV